MLKLFLSSKDIKEIILAGKDANCSSIIYNGLHITYNGHSAPCDEPWPVIPTATNFSQSDNPTNKEVIGDEASIMSLDLQYKMHEDPVAFEEALAQGAEWNKNLNQKK